MLETEAVFETPKQWEVGSVKNTLSWTSSEGEKMWLLRISHAMGNVVLLFSECFSSFSVSETFYYWDPQFRMTIYRDQTEVMSLTWE